MKSIWILMISSSLLLGVPSFNSTEENRRIEADQVSLWIGKLSMAKAKPPTERVGDLALGLRNMGYRKGYEGHSPSVDTIYGDLQKEMLSIPGHAQYFADKIEHDQKAVERYPTNTGPRVSYDFQRSLYFEFLSHLPSPETIAVLGHFLSDDKDTPNPLMSPNSDWGENPRANSFFSSSTIRSVGLRDPPVEAQRRNDDPDIRLAETREWWEEIKSGNRPFSFLGQKLEYRFKPDGTWEAIALVNPPDDAPKWPSPRSASEEMEPKKSLTSASPGVGAVGKNSPWLWLISVSLLVGSISWMKMRKA